MYRIISRLLGFTTSDKCSRSRQKRFLLSLESMEDRIVPAVYNVVSLSDLGQGVGVQGDLRYCMNKANNGDLIDFQVSGNISLNGPLPPLKSITIDGDGQNVEIWGNLISGPAPYGIFEVNVGVTATIKNINIYNGQDSDGGGVFNAGDLTLENDSLLQNQAEDGGAIFNASGATLTMENVSLNSNTATNRGGGILNSGTLYCLEHSSIVQNKANSGGLNGGLGGGLANIGGHTELDQGIQISGNTATNTGGGTADGGGIYQSGGTITMSGSVMGGAIENNSATCGGGIYVFSGSLDIDGPISISNNKGGTPNGNEAIGGGGIFNSGGAVYLTGGQVSNNSAGQGGGIFTFGGLTVLKDENVKFNTASGNGAGIFLAGGQVTVSGGWVQENTAGGSGGGLYNSNGTLKLTGSVAVNDNGAANQGGGLYLRDGSSESTTFDGCLVSGNTTDGSQQSTGWGVYYEKGAVVTSLSLTDDDDPGGDPIKGS